MVKISVIVPVYEMHGRGVEFLNELIESLFMQNYENYEVIITDNSTDNTIKNYLEDTWEHDDIIYTRNKGNSAAVNFNHGMTLATGEVIKPLFQDDKLISHNTLGNIAHAFEEPINWVCMVSNNQGDSNWVHHPYQYPSYRELLEGENSYGSPSVIAFWNCDLRFDENLIWLMDCEFYTRLIKKFGTPKLLEDEIFIRQWPGQVTNTTAVGGVRIQETEYVFTKHGI